VINNTQYTTTEDYSNNNQKTIYQLLTVGGDIDLVGHLGHLHGEALLHLLHLLLILRSIVIGKRIEKSENSQNSGKDNEQWSCVGWRTDRLQCAGEHNNIIPGDEGHGETLGAEATRSADSVEVLVTLVGEIVVDHDVHALNVDT